MQISPSRTIINIIIYIHTSLNKNKMKLSKKAQEGGGFGGLPFLGKLILIVVVIVIVVAFIIKAGEKLGAWEFPLF